MSRAISKNEASASEEKTQNFRIIVVLVVLLFLTFKKYV